MTSQVTRTSSLWSSVIKTKVPRLKSSLSVTFLIFLLVVRTLVSILARLTFFLSESAEEQVSRSHSLASQDFIQGDISRKKVQSLPLRLQNLSSHLASATLRTLQTPGSMWRVQLRQNSSFQLVSRSLWWSKDSTDSTTLSIRSKSEEVNFLGSLALPSCLKSRGTRLLLKQVLEKARRLAKAVRILPSQSSKPTFLSIGLQLLSSGEPLKILKQESSVLKAFLAWRAPLKISVLKLLKKSMSPTLRLRVKSSLRLLQRQTWVGYPAAVLSMIFSFWVQSRLASYLQTLEQSTIRPMELCRDGSLGEVLCFQTYFRSCSRFRSCRLML